MQNALIYGSAICALVGVVSLVAGPKRFPDLAGIASGIGLLLGTISFFA